MPYKNHFMKKTLVVLALVFAFVLVGCTTVSALAATSNALGGLVGEAKGTYLYSLDAKNKSKDKIVSNFISKS